MPGFLVFLFKFCVKIVFFFGNILELLLLRSSRFGHQAALPLHSYKIGHQVAPLLISFRFGHQAAPPLHSSKLATRQRHRYQARAKCGRPQAFHELRRYHTRPLQLNWGPENVHFRKTLIWDTNINVRKI